MTLGDLLNKYPKSLDWEIVVSEDRMMLEKKPIKKTIFGVDNNGPKIYLIY